MQPLQQTHDVEPGAPENECSAQFMKSKNLLSDCA